MKCHRCPRKSPETTLYRVNEKDEPGVWACKEHKGDIPNDPLVDILDGTSGDEK